MAIITASASISTISYSGNSAKSGTMSWTKPTVPSGAIISSCKLTGTCVVSASSRQVTVKVNGTTVANKASSGNYNFEIDLGTSNNTTSVTVTATGSQKQASGTVSFSNLVYTVTYETNVTYTVTFKDWDGTVLNTQTVNEGSSATAPSNPVREGYRFIGWDKDFSSITSNLTVTAQYKEIIEKEMCIYSFDSSIDTLPVFNDGYEYRYTDVTNSDGTITRTIFSEIEPTNIDFKECTGLKTLDYMDLTNLITFENMFSGCTLLTTVKLENCPANANTVNNFQSTFARCTSLTHAYISGINFENARYMNNMFHSCPSLEYVDFGNFNSIHGLNFASTFFYGTTGKFNTVVVDNPPANSMNKLIGLLPVRTGTLPSGTIIHNATDTSEWDIETLNSRNWQLLNNNLPRYMVTFVDWDGTVLKTEQVVEGTSATAPSNPSRDGYNFTGWDVSFNNVTSNLTVTAQYEKIEEPEVPERETIEWTGIGTVASNLSSDIDHDNYKINIDWDNECFDVVITDYAFSLTDFNYSIIGELRIGDESYVITFDSKMQLHNLHDEVIITSTEGNLPATLRFSKNGVYLLENDIIVDQTTDVNYTSNDPILFYNSTSYKGNETKFNLIVNELPKEEPEEPETPDEPEGPSSFMFNGMPINIMFLGEDKIIAIFMGDNKLF